MLILAVAILAVLLMGGQVESTLRVRGRSPVMVAARVGRVRLAARTYRPGRVYVQLAVA